MKAFNPPVDDWTPPPDAVLRGDQIPAVTPTGPTERDHTDDFPLVDAVLDKVTSNPTAKMTEQIGQAIRAGLGIGALALLPDLLADLKRSKDPDSRIKFLAMAIKEGGYGVREDKTSNLPVFHFNFVNAAGVTITTTGPQVPKETLDILDLDSTPLLSAPAAAKNSLSDQINADFAPPSDESVKMDLFSMIEA